MANSILRDVKKVLALNPDDTDFDLDILMHINAVITILEDLGAGPIKGFLSSGTRSRRGTTTSATARRTTRSRPISTYESECSSTRHPTLSSSRRSRSRSMSSPGVSL